MKIVIDASSFFYGFQIDGKNEYITTQSVLDEIRGKRMRDNIEQRIFMLEVGSPSHLSLNKVKEESEKTGDINHLSSADLELIALAAEREAILLTNDLAIQNVCKKLAIPYKAFGGKEIKEEIEWGYRCIGCGKIFYKKTKACPHCGSEIRKFPKKRKTIT